jgi:drug/metabolite transporter (DMT)-like permease
MQPTRRQSLIAHLLLLAVVFVWGVTFTLVKSALNHVSPLLFNLLRMAIAAIVLLAINFSSLKKLTAQDLRLGALVGVFLAIGYQFQTAGLTLTTPSKSAFITGLVVVFVPLLAIIPHLAPPGAPKPTFATGAGALLAFIGLALLTAPAGTGFALLSGFHLGETLTLGCAIAFAAHLLTIARAAPRIPARRLGTLQIAFAALTMLVLLPLEKLTPGGIHFQSAPVVWIALAVTALLATAAAFTIQSWAQQHLPASHTALIFTLEPVFAWLFSLLFLGERLGPRALTGAGLILAGILLAELASTSPSDKFEANSTANPGIL